MPARPLRPCTTPGCPGRAEQGPCPQCLTRRQANPRTAEQTAARRGYSSTWRRHRRIEYLTAHPVCVLCGHLAEVPDHYPTSRRDLISQGATDPDADEHLRPLCRRCHNRQTGHRQPGGWWRLETP